MKRKFWLHRALPLGAVLGVMVLSGCDPNIPSEGPHPERVEPIFDPATSTIPLPNDLALDSGTLPTLPGAGEESAEGVFLSYLSELTGWLPTTPIEVPFSGPLDEDSLTEESVRLFRFEGEELVEISSTLVYDEHESGQSIVRVVPQDVLFAQGERYGVVVTKDVIGANGAAIAEPLAIFFAASRTPLIDSDGNPTLSVLADDPAQAQTLEGLRQFLAPFFTALEEREEPIDRNEVAMLFQWTISADPVAVFNPDEGRVPLPNTAALDADGTFPRAGTCFAGQNNANGYFDNYLAQLSGWPDATPITLPLSGPIDESSLGDDVVQLYRRGDSGWDRVEDVTVVYLTESIDNCTGEVSQAYSLRVVYDEMDIREEYFAFATRELASADGRALRPEVAMLMAMQPYPIVDGEGNSLVGSFGAGQAQALAGLQAILAEPMGYLADTQELTYEDLLTVWSWYTWNDTFIVFDPTAGRIPFPNAFLEEDGTVNLPIPADADPLTAGILQTLNLRRGFSTSAPGWIPVDGTIDESTVGYESVALAPEDGASSRLLRDEDFRIDYDPSWGHIIVEPLVPLQTNKLHAGLVTTAMIGANGRPVQPTPPFVFLRSPHPLANANGESLIYALNDEAAVQLEAARTVYTRLFLLAMIIDGSRFSREQIVTAWAFDTDDPSEQLLRLRAQAMFSLENRSEIRATRPCEATSCASDSNLVLLTEDSMADPNSGAMIDMSNVSAIQYVGEFDSIQYDQTTRSLTDNLIPVGISVFIPRATQSDGQCEAPFDVVIAQHGLGGTRLQSGLAQANELAAFPNCLATVSMDFPLHGGRAASAGGLHPETTPAENGAGFLSPDLLGSKGNFMQGIVDLFILRRIIEGDEGVNGLESLFAAGNGGGLGGIIPGIIGGGANGPENLFSDQIGYVGVSLGGILGVAFAGLDPGIDTAVINAAGGRLAWILEGDDDGPSTIGTGILAAFASMGLLPGTFPFIQTLSFVQWTADIFDPFTIGPTGANGDRRVLVYDGQDFGPVTGGACAQSDECPASWRCEQDVCVEYLPPTQYLVQMAQGDRTIVNRSTEALAKALDVSLEDTTFDAPHSFMNIRNASTPGYDEGLCARLQAASWLGSGLAGMAELLDELRAENCLN